MARDAQLTIRYDRDKRDLSGMIEKLSELEKSRFHGWSISKVGEILLGEALERELKRLK